MDGIVKARGLVAEAERIVVLTGAGISTGAGIPDYRGPEGVWTKNPLAERMSNLADYLADTEVRRLVWLRRCASPVLGAEPTAAHKALVGFEATGRLAAVVTQNTDGLHLAAGQDPRLLLEMHGDVRLWRCESCGLTGPFAQMVERVRAGEDDPDCPACGGIVRATVVLFGEGLDPDLVDRAWSEAKRADLLVAIGSTLVVQPVAALVPLACSHGARLVIVNAEPTPYDRLADVVLRADIQGVVPALFA
ncbi:MAG: Sir2 family NAD-dependent protein deacetylase [Propionibacteriaceae bacterium]|jgi:NAD-dependent deacetylase|nr:Sir2 family NAD-dependent protein deacetylase [Propionibacteriaceae bacterium]